MCVVSHRVVALCHLLNVPLTICIRIKYSPSKSHFFTSESDNQVSEAIFNEADRGNRDDIVDYSTNHGNDFFTYIIPETILDTKRNTNQITMQSRRNTNNAEPVFVISNLDSEHDITSMVDQLLLNNEFSDDSSIFVIVPSSDDNDSDISSDCSTICIELSKHQPNWNQKQYNLEPGKHFFPLVLNI